MDRRTLVGFLAALPALAGIDLSPLEAAAVSGRRALAPGARGLLTPHQRELADQVAELIMPATDTPGARAAGVVDFIDLIVSEYYHDDERAVFLRGLDEIDPRAHAAFGKPFMELNERQQQALLTGLEAEWRALPPGSPSHFFGRMRGLTLYGYYTSEVGYTQELHGVLMPGRYEGDVPVGRMR